MDACGLDLTSRHSHKFTNSLVICHVDSLTHFHSFFSVSFVMSSCRHVVSRTTAQVLQVCVQRPVAFIASMYVCVSWCDTVRYFGSAECASF